MSGSSGRSSNSSPRLSKIPPPPCGCPPPPCGCPPRPSGCPPPPCGCPPRPSGCPPPPCGCPPRPSGCPPPPCGCPPRPSGCPPPPCGCPPRPCGCPPSKCGCPPPSGPGLMSTIASYIYDWIFQKAPCDPCSSSTSPRSSSFFSDVSQWISFDKIRNSKTVSDIICKFFPKICPEQSLDCQPAPEPPGCLEKYTTAISNFFYMERATKSVFLATVVFIGGVSVARRMRFIVESLNVV